MNLREIQLAPVHKSKCPGAALRIEGHSQLRGKPAAVEQVCLAPALPQIGEQVQRMLVVLAAKDQDRFIGHTLACQDGPANDSTKGRTRFLGASNVATSVSRN